MKAHQETLKNIYENWKTEDLIKTVTIDKAAYEPLALEVMGKELQRRSVNKDDLAKSQGGYIPEEGAQSPEETLEKIYAFVIAQMKGGIDKLTISERLERMGVNKDDAVQLVETIYPQILKAVEKEQITISSRVPASVVGGLAALLGGGLWGLIVVGTGRVIGFMALGMGWLSGYAVALFLKGRKGFQLQIIAVLSSVLGIAIGKYFIFFHYLKEFARKEYGAEKASNIPIFSMRIIQLFIERIGSVVSAFDILWVILAVITAWSIPEGSGIKLPKRKSSY